MKIIKIYLRSVKNVVIFLQEKLLKDIKKIVKDKYNKIFKSMNLNAYFVMNNYQKIKFIMVVAIMLYISFIFIKYLSFKSNYEKRIQNK